MARAGIRDFLLLHGVRNPDQAYYRALLQSSAARYVICISGAAASHPEEFEGRVSDFLLKALSPGAYDFYLSGRREMVRDVTWIVDERFNGSRIYSEVFF
jgi:ferredoxin-NADP reductase